jgi:integrase
MREIAAGKTAKTIKGSTRGVSRFKGGPGAATRTVGLLQGIFSFAESRAIVATNPTRGVRRFSDKKRERFLSPKELSKLGEALSEKAAAGVNPNGLNIIRLLCLTGARRGEIEALCWHEIDLDRGLVRLRDSKTGAKVFPLAPAALSLLSKLKAQRSSDTWVFPATTGEGHFAGTGKIWSAVRKTANLEDVRLHDLRHTFASFGASAGYGLPVIGAILGHSQASTTARYAHLADDPVSEAASRIGNEISHWIEGGRAG